MMRNKFISVCYRQASVDRSSQEDDAEMTQNGEVDMSSTRHAHASPSSMMDSGVEGLHSLGQLDAINNCKHTLHHMDGCPNKDGTPLLRRISNLTSDSGRSSSIDNSDLLVNNALHERRGNFSNGAHKKMTHCMSEDVSSSRRYSTSVIDSTGHLRVPTPSDCTSSTEQFTDTTDSQPNQDSPFSEDADSDRKVSSSSASSQPKSQRTASPRTKRAPQIIYSHSEDKLTTTESSRPICPSLPYSPYGSPCGSPRLRRQPTRETRSLSITDGDGYTQLNQYKLKDEIGKVGRSHMIMFILQIIWVIQNCFKYKCGG